MPRLVTFSATDAGGVGKPVGLSEVMPALWQQESGGRPGIRGPQTKYGQALGIGQTLPGTAREMAQKLGLPWKPELLTGTDPNAANYQKQLSAAYFTEGLNKTGNMRDALHFYHGGPNRKLWGPKTRSYANSVLGRIGRR